MNLGILILFSFVATAMSECEIHDQKYSHHGGYYITYQDINDFGVAALANDVDAVDPLIMKVEWMKCLP